MDESQERQGTKHAGLKVGLLVFLVPIFLIIVLQLWEGAIYLLRAIGLEAPWLFRIIGTCGLISSLWFTYWASRKIWRYDP